MFSTYALQGLETKEKGVYSREELAPLAQINVESLKEFDFFTFGKADGKKEKFLRAGRLLPGTQGRRADAAFHAAAEDAGKAESSGAGSVRSARIFIDFKFDDKDPITLVGAPAACKLVFQRPNDGTATAQKLDRRQFRQRRQFELRRACSPTRSRWNARDRADRPETRAWRDGLAPRSWPRDAARRRCDDPALAQTAVRRADARRRRTPGRRHRRLDPRQAIGILPRDVRDHPRRQVRRHRGLDAARDFLRLRHLPRRRSRPRQGGDLVLPRRQRGDRAARHRAVVRLGADAVAGRGR